MQTYRAQFQFCEWIQVKLFDKNYTSQINLKDFDAVLAASTLTHRLSVMTPFQ